MAHAHVTLSNEVPDVDTAGFTKYVAQALCDATGKPEAYILVTVSREELVVGFFPQSQVLLQLTIIGTDDPFRSEQISSFLSHRLLLYMQDLVPSQINIIITYRQRGNTSICGRLV